MKIEVGYMGLCAGAGLMVALPVAGCGPAAKDKTPLPHAAIAQAPESVSHAAPSTPGRGPTVLFIGTSLTAGLGLQADQAYPALVQAKANSAGKPIRAINAGVSGETSAGALNRIGWIMREPADIVVIETGANDALRALPVAEARSNIARILDSVKAAKPKARIFLVQMEAPPNLGPEYTRAFHAMYGELARETGATLVPFLLQGVAGIPSLNQADGVHPNFRGEEIVARTVWRALEPAITG